MSRNRTRKCTSFPLSLAPDGPLAYRPSRGLPLIMVMEAANFRQGHDPTDIRWLDGSGIWAIHLEGKMRAKAVIVGNIRQEHALQMPVVAHDDMIEHVVPHAADNPLAGRILPGISRGDLDFFAAPVLDALLERHTIDRVPIP